MSSCSTRAEPAVAVDLGALEQARIGTGGGLDHAQCAVLEPQRGDGRVFDLDPLVGQRGRSCAVIDSTSPISQ